MPLFQPSNITPSSFAGVGGGTVAVADNIKITWQVNGNVPMTAYKIDIFDMNNKAIYSSDILTGNTPFYPTDNKGNPQYFSYEPNSTWESLGLSDGNEYTLQITQYWGNSTDENHSVTQFSQSSFITRTIPTLSITTESGVVDFTEINGVSQDFKAIYAQSQNDSIDWVSWKLYRIDSGEEIVLDETGAINTQLLAYQADGLLTGNTYKIECTIQTEKGVQVLDSKTFLVEYTLENVQEDIYGFDGSDEYSNLLGWKSDILTIKGSVLNGKSNDNRYKFIDNKLYLPNGSNVIWAQDGDNNLEILPDWTLAYKASIPSFNFNEYEESFNDMPYLQTGTISVTSQDIEKFPMSISYVDNNLDPLLHPTLNITYWFHSFGSVSPHGYIYIYDIDSGGAGVTIKDFALSSNGYMSGCNISPDGNWLCCIAGFKDDSTVQVYRLTSNGKSITSTFSLKSISGNNLTTIFKFVVFNQSSTKLYLFSSDWKILEYDVSEKNISFSKQYDFNATNEINSINDIRFIGDNYFCISYYDTRTTGKTEIYSLDSSILLSENYVASSIAVSGNTVSFGGKIYKITYGSIQDFQTLNSVGYTNFLSFSPNGVFLFIAPYSSNNISVYKYNETEKKYNIYKSFELKQTIVAGTKVKTNNQILFRPGSVANEKLTYIKHFSDIGYATTIDPQKGKIISVETNNINDNILNHSVSIYNNEILFICQPKTILEPISFQYKIEYNESLMYSENQICLDLGGYFKLGRIGKKATIYVNGTTQELVLEYGIKELFVLLTKNSCKLQFLSETNSIIQEKEYTPTIGFTQKSIAWVNLYGEQACKYIYISQESADGLSYDFIPNWGANTKFLTNFGKNTLQAGEEGGSTNGIDIYRDKISNLNGAVVERIKLFSCEDENIKSVRDYSWITGNYYNYYSYAKIGNKYTKEYSFTSKPVCKKQNYYLLIATEQDLENPNVYHLVYYWKFGNNIEASAISNNNTPNFLNNFTGYRLKQPTARKGKSGTLTALLSNAKAGEYKDTAQEMENLYALSQCKNPLFLKDMKGNFYMVSVSGAITQTINVKSTAQEVKMSLPWEEVGSTKNVVIIKTSDKFDGLDSVVSLSDVRLEVDIETGMLKTVYPDSYDNSTLFKLRQPDLIAETLSGGTADLSIVDGSVILKINEG